jgi:hypothetical protein
MVYETMIFAQNCTLYRPPGRTVPVQVWASEVAAAGFESYAWSYEIPAFSADFDRQLVDMPAALPCV